MGRFDNMSPEAMAAWGALTAQYPDLEVNSAYRDPAHNKRVGGAKRSQHVHGNAFDINARGMTKAQRLKLIEDARKAGFGGIGVYDNALHFDVGPTRAWGPSYKSDSIPAWAASAVGSAPRGTLPNTPPPGQAQSLPAALPNTPPPGTPQGEEKSGLLAQLLAAFDEQPDFMEYMQGMQGQPAQIPQPPQRQMAPEGTFQRRDSMQYAQSLMDLLKGL